MDNKKEIIYIAELDADVDDIIAVEYLNHKNVLKCVVLDPYPKTDIGKKRMKMLTDENIKIEKKVPPNTKYIFVGGQLTEVARYITTHHIDCLVMNGGYVGSNIVDENNQLEKFKNKKTVRTFNFNCDINATQKVLTSNEKQIGQIILVGKNVCHSIKNTELNLWNDKFSKEILKKYNVKKDKRQHDMLACHEGLCALNFINEQPYCNFAEVYPYNEGINGNMTKWGSKLEKTNYRKVTSAVSYKENK